MLWVGLSDTLLLPGCSTAPAEYVSEHRSQSGPRPRPNGAFRGSAAVWRNTLRARRLARCSRPRRSVALQVDIQHSRPKLSCTATTERGPPTRVWGRRSVAVHIAVKHPAQRTHGTVKDFDRATSHAKRKSPPTALEATGGRNALSMFQGRATGKGNWRAILPAACGSAWLSSRSRAQDPRCPPCASGLCRCRSPPGNLR